MRINSLKLFFFVIITLLSATIKCTTTEIAGGSSGTEVSAFVGTVLNEDGTPASNAIVKIRPSTFLNDSALSPEYCSTHTIIDTQTNNSGNFVISSLFPDNYTIEAIVNDSLAAETKHQIIDNSMADTLVPLYVSPLAELTGYAQIQYGEPLNIQIQPYGLDRVAVIESTGEFSLKIPHGPHAIHFEASQSTDSLHQHSSYQMDISVNLSPGERRDTGAISLRAQPPSPCEDGRCDSLVVNNILYKTDHSDIALEQCIQTNSEGRIISFNAKNLRLPRGMPIDIVRLSALESLDLSYTELPNPFPNMDRLTQLRTLNLSHNRLHFISRSTGGLANLQELDLSYNQLSELPDTITNCSALIKIDLSNNYLCDIPDKIVQFLDAIDTTWKTTQHCH